MPLYAAIDLHSNNGVLSVIDDEERVRYEKRLPNDLAQVLRALEPFRGELAGVAVESTYNWYWLVDGLIEHDHPVRLVNTSAVPQYAGLKFGNDHSDARHLAHLMRLKILPEGYIYPREQRGLRDLLRLRFRLVQQATRVTHAVQVAFARRTGGRLTMPDLLDLDDATLTKRFSHPCERLAMASQLALREDVEKRVVQVEKQVLRQLRDDPARKAVQTVPGIGPVLGATIVLESGPMERFDQVGNYLS